jgi:hypothetical protein
MVIPFEWCARASQGSGGCIQSAMNVYLRERASMRLDEMSWSRANHFTHHCAIYLDSKQPCLFHFMTIG